MPTYNSNRGVWTPAHEETYIDYSQSKFKVNKGRKGKFYSGPDRAATEQLMEIGEDHLGMDVANDPQLMDVAQKYNITVEQYLERFKPTAKQESAKLEADKKIVDHSAPTSKAGVNPQGGGVTETGKFVDEGKMPV